MCLRYHSSLAKFLTYMLLSFFISCESAKNKENTAITQFVQPIFIPIKRTWFDYYDEGPWRYVIQKVEYIDGKTLSSLSSVWILDFMPVEIIVLDNPNPSEKLVFTFRKGDHVILRKTNVFLPFLTTSKTDGFDEFLPKCNGGEFRAIARIADNLEYIGIPKEDYGEEDKQKRPWFVLGNVLCLKIINL